MTAPREGLEKLKKCGHYLLYECSGGGIKIYGNELIAHSGMCADEYPFSISAAKSPEPVTPAATPAAAAAMLENLFASASNSKSSANTSSPPTGSSSSIERKASTHAKVEVLQPKP